MRSFIFTTGIPFSKILRNVGRFFVTIKFGLLLLIGMLLLKKSAIVDKETLRRIDQPMKLKS